MPSKQAQKQWGTAAKTESRIPTTIAVLIAAMVNYFLPGRYIVGPNWLVPAIEIAIIIPLFISAPRRTANETRLQQAMAIAIIAVANLANTASLVLLIHQLIYQSKGIDGTTLLLSAAAIWGTNIIVFGLWYWELDRGGPDDRLRAAHAQPDFLFPQMSTPGCTVEDWSPKFIDYLFVAFTNATAFSPTDTMPLTPWAKVLMMLQALSSLATIVIVAARGINILQ
jgi:uncharacterized membrane protein